MANELEITIEHEERDGSPVETSSFSEGFAATRLLECAWEDRLALKDQLQGKTESVEGVTSWFLPHLYPYGDELARVTNVTINPFGETGGNAQTLNPEISYTKALLTVNYAISTVSYTDPEQEHNISDSLSGAAKVLSAVGGAGFWADNTPVNVENSPSRQIIMQEWSRTISRVKSVSQTVFDGVGKVNDADIEYPGFGIDLTFKKETLLMLPMNIRDEFAPDGSRFLNVTAKFVWIGTLPAINVQAGDITHGGWNHSFKPKESSPERIYESATPEINTIVYTYELTDLGAIIDELED
jgi:hypothetical protein